MPKHDGSPSSRVGTAEVVAVIEILAEEETIKVVIETVAVAPQVVVAEVVAAKAVARK